MKKMKGEILKDKNNKKMIFGNDAETEEEIKKKIKEYEEKNLNEEKINGLD